MRERVSEIISADCEILKFVVFVSCLRGRRLGIKSVSCRRWKILWYTCVFVHQTPSLQAHNVLDGDWRFCASSSVGKILLYIFTTIGKHRNHFRQVQLDETNLGKKPSRLPSLLAAWRANGISFLVRHRRAKSNHSCFGEQCTTQESMSADDIDLVS